MVEKPPSSVTAGKMDWWRRLMTGLSFGVCALAIAAVYHGLKDTDWGLVWRDLRGISPWDLGQAMIFVACSYGAIAWYDILAFRYIERTLARRKIAFAGLITYAISPNVGFAFLSGSVLRYRLYRHWQISPLDIAKVIAFTNLSLWIGLIPITGLVFTFTDFTIPPAIAQQLPSLSPGAIGILLLSVSAIYLAYLALISRQKTVWRWQNFAFKLPSLALTYQQILVFALDWGFAALTLYFLLGEPLNYFSFFGIYVVAMVLGLVSTVPGGLGVFETTIIYFLAVEQSPEKTLATLIVFRCLYYFLPFVLAVIALLGFEARQQIQARRR